MVVDSPCFSSAWEKTSRSHSMKERGEEQEKSGEGKIGLLRAAGSTQFP